MGSVRVLLRLEIIDEQRRTYCPPAALHRAGTKNNKSRGSAPSEQNNQKQTIVRQKSVLSDNSLQ